MSGSGRGLSEMVGRGGSSTIDFVGADDSKSVSGHLPSLTSLRWLAATVVFLRHAQVVPRLGAQGATGVSFFFMLSGFVLTWSARPSQSPRAFYLRRLARIYPSHAVSTLVCAPVLMAVGLMSVKDDLLPGLLTFTGMQSWVPKSSYYYGGNLVSWSLSDEAFFYLVFPIVAAPLARLAARARRDLWIVLGALSTVSIALPVILRPSEEGGVPFWLVYISPPFRLIEFVIGIGLAHALIQGGLPRLHLPTCGAIALAAYVIAGWLPAYAMWSATTLLPYSILLLAVAQSDAEGRTPTWLAHPLLVTLGTWSFAFYLVHSTVLVATRGLVAKLDLNVGPWSQAALCYAVAVAAAWALHTAVEVPAERWIRRRWIAPEPASG